VTVRIDVVSQLAAAPDVVWRHVSTFAGVNAELWPIRMSAPPEIHALRADLLKPTPFLFASWISLWGIIPLDRHSVGLERIEPGRGFDEVSTSWLMRRWTHGRRIEPVPHGCRLTDTVTFDCRLPGVGGLLAPIYRLVFNRRHAWLRRRFGVAGG
jgi:hypothetical protein